MHTGILEVEWTHTPYEPATKEQSDECGNGTTGLMPEETWYPTSLKGQTIEARDWVVTKVMCACDYQSLRQSLTSNASSTSNTMTASANHFTKQRVRELSCGQSIHSLVCHSVI
jgi:hypothetical protein